MINVTKTFLPPFEEYQEQLKRAWDKSWLTNNGILVQELEASLKKYLRVSNLLFCGNGTIVLQMALKALGVTGEVITTPFSYVASTTAIMGEGCKPIFVDIDERTFCIDASKIEAAITPRTQAILATHVYGYPCDVAAIETVAKKHGLKVIYDAAHAFGTELDGRSILSYGDLSTCSFHATKLFHTVEGGCIVSPDAEIAQRVLLSRQFGHIGDDYYSVGINAKNSEFHAAMGICNLKHLKSLMANRKRQWVFYSDALSSGNHQILNIPDNISYNYAYFPIVFNSEADLLNALHALNSEEIFPRRYFHPSLNTLPYVDYRACPISERISAKVMCLPLFDDLSLHDQERVISTIKSSSAVSGF